MVDVTFSFSMFDVFLTVAIATILLLIYGFISVNKKDGDGSLKEVKDPNSTADTQAFLPDGHDSPIHEMRTEFIEGSPAPFDLTSGNVPQADEDLFGEDDSLVHDSDDGDIPYGDDDEEEDDVTEAALHGDAAAGRRTPAVDEEAVLCLKQLAENKFVFFDLETTGFGTHAEIVQLSAISGTRTFDQYVFPEGPINPGSSEIHHITKVGQQLFYKGEPVESVPVLEAIKSFLEWVTDVGPPCVLCAHNARSFDCRILLGVIRKYHLVEELAAVTMGFLDTLHLFRATLPGLSSYKQSSLVAEVLHLEYDAHNALADVTSLQQLFDKVAPSPETMRPHTFSVKFFMENEDRRASLRSLEKAGAITPYMAKKMSNAKVTSFDLAERFRTGGREGLEHFLSESVDVNTPRVTKNKRCINKILDYFENRRDPVVRNPTSLFGAE